MRSDSEPPARGAASGEPRRVTLDPDGPVLIEGPVEIVLDDGTLVRSQRFQVALCTCRRSRTYPWCDTSHRKRTRPAQSPSSEDSPRPAAPSGPTNRAPVQDRSM
ncbi:CDGSH iron-sulfur domain-containing protein [Streptomyces sp. NPDC059980]|uniref:CDGSH iron-sulfur domain-containing protein n=1 Tax=Streptomyces sp. NPDC059980 TaxID=3347022 RepID=UPI0036B8BF1B